MYTIYDYAYNGLLYLNNSLSPVAMVGLQKRYAPAVQILQRHLRKEHLISYDLHYLTGNYPEGDAPLDLYIHPHNKNIEHLYARNNFTPLLPDNQLYSQGYFNEIQAFIDAVESCQFHLLANLQSVRTVYEVISEIQESKRVIPKR